MKDIKSFCKMFDLNVASFEDFDYYRDQFSRLDRWKNMDDLVSLYEKAELNIDDMFKYRMDKIEEIIDFIKGTRAYNDMVDDNLIPDYPTNKNFEYFEGVNYLSIDLRMANWQAMKKYDPSFINELGETYSDLLNKFEVPEVFHRSKHFRQYIFGNLNPKRQIKMQRVLVQDIFNALEKYGLKVECIKHDEIIYSFNKIEDVREIIEGLDGEDFTVRAFSIKKVENFRINQYLCKDSGKILHSEPVGCNGHKFFMYLKKYIFNEPYDIRDLYFRMDGELAIWNTDNLKLELND
jgi:nucleoside diphosphate kinase